MTVCIAAICKDKEKNEQRIIHCTDWLSSTVLGSAEGSLKQYNLGRKWSFMGSGSSSEFQSLIALLKAAFHNHTGPLDEVTVPEIVKGALRQRMSAKIEDHVQGKIGISYEKLIDIGRDKLPLEIYRELMVEVSNISLRVDGIVTGFCDDGEPLIIQTGPKCELSIRENYAVVGEGSYLAKSIMIYRNHTGQRPINEALYNVYEAKRFAESVRSVGPKTCLSFRFADGRAKLVDNETIDRLEDQRNMWFLKLPRAFDYSISFVVFD